MVCEETCSERDCLVYGHMEMARDERILRQGSQNCLLGIWQAIPQTPLISLCSVAGQPEVASNNDSLWLVLSH